MSWSRDDDLLIGAVIFRLMGDDVKIAHYLDYQQAMSVFGFGEKDAHFVLSRVVRDFHELHE